MRQILRCVVAALVVAGGGWADDKPVKIDAKKLLGKWKLTDEKGKAANLVAEFKADGKMSVTGDFDGKTQEVPGTYKVEGDKLVMKMKIMDRETDEVATVLKLTDDELVTRDKNGKEQTFARVKAKKDDK